MGERLKAALKRKEPLKKNVRLAASDEEAQEIYIYIYQSKKKVSEQFRRKMNEDVNGNRKLF